MTGIQIFCVSETWLSPNVLDEHVTVPNYNVYRCDKGKGGGFCIYVKDMFNAPRIDVTTERPEGVEDLWLTVEYRKLPSVIIGCLYRHPKFANAQLCN